MGGKRWRMSFHKSRASPLEFVNCYRSVRMSLLLYIAPKCTNEAEQKSSILGIKCRWSHRKGRYSYKWPVWVLGKAGHVHVHTFPFRVLFNTHYEVTIDIDLLQEHKKNISSHQDRSKLEETLEVLIIVQYLVNAWSLVMRSLEEVK